MRFPYIAVPTRRPIYPLGGVWFRYRPLVSIRIGGLSGDRILTANLDSGADDTLFPAYLATRLGIDLANAAAGEAGAISGPATPYRYATVRLRLTDGYEESN